MNAPMQDKCGSETDFSGMFSDLDILWAAFRVGMKKHLASPDGEVRPGESEGAYHKRAEQAGILAVVEALRKVGAMR